MIIPDKSRQDTTAFHPKLPFSSLVIWSIIFHFAFWNIRKLETKVFYYEILNFDLSNYSASVCRRQW